MVFQTPPGFELEIEVKLVKLTAHDGEPSLKLEIVHISKDHCNRLQQPEEVALQTMMERSLFSMILAIDEVRLASVEKENVVILTRCYHDSSQCSGCSVIAVQRKDH